jgi:hypothetical protein
MLAIPHNLIVAVIDYLKQGRLTVIINNTTCRQQISSRVIVILNKIIIQAGCHPRHHGQNSHRSGKLSLGRVKTVDVKGKKTFTFVLNTRILWDSIEAISLGHVVRHWYKNKSCLLF